MQYGLLLQILYVFFWPKAFTVLYVQVSTSDSTCSVTAFASFAFENDVGLAVYFEISKVIPDGSTIDSVRYEVWQWVA